MSECGSKGIRDPFRSIAGGNRMPETPLLSCRGLWSGTGGRWGWSLMFNEESKKKVPLWLGGWHLVTGNHKDGLQEVQRMSEKSFSDQTQPAVIFGTHHKVESAIMVMVRATNDRGVIPSVPLTDSLWF